MNFKIKLSHAYILIIVISILFAVIVQKRKQLRLSKLLVQNQAMQRVKEHFKSAFQARPTEDYSYTLSDDKDGFYTISVEHKFSNESMTYTFLDSSCISITTRGRSFKKLLDFK